MNISTVLKNNDLSIYSLSKESGVPLGTVKKIINGKYDIGKCAAQTVRKLAEALNCTMEELLDMSFIKSIPSLSSFPTKTDYYREMMTNRKNLILAKESALEYLGLSSSNLDEHVYVYGCNDLSDPFVVNKVSNFKNLSYQNSNGILVTSVDQTINDMLEDPSADQQHILEALSTYYFEHDESFDGLRIKPENAEPFKQYSNDAVSYYDE